MFQPLSFPHQTSTCHSRADAAAFRSTPASGTTRPTRPCWRHLGLSSVHWSLPLSGGQRPVVSSLSPRQRKQPGCLNLFQPADSTGYFFREACLQLSEAPKWHLSSILTSQRDPEVEPHILHIPLLMSIRMLRAEGSIPGRRPTQKGTGAGRGSRHGFPVLTKTLPPSEDHLQRKN